MGTKERGFAISGLVNRYQVIVFILDVHGCIYVPPILSRSSNRLHDCDTALP